MRWLMHRGAWIAERSTHGATVTCAAARQSVGLNTKRGGAVGSGRDDQACEAHEAHPYCVGGYSRSLASAARLPASRMPLRCE
jgi:hypothetical protein